MKEREQRTLMILRHAKALKGTPMPDRDRPLTTEGREQIKLMRRYALAAELIPELVLTSDALRARATAADFCGKFAPPPPLVLMRELYDADGDDILAVIRQQPDRVTRLLLVGHNPALEDAVRQLCVKSGPKEVDFATGGLAVFTVAGSWAGVDATAVIRAEIVLPRDVR